MAGFVIRWTGWHLRKEEGPIFAKRDRRSDRIGAWTTDKKEATVFPVRDQAVQFVKKNIRNGRFGGDWQSVCTIEEV